MDFSLTELLLTLAIFFILCGPGLYRFSQRLARWQRRGSRRARARRRPAPPPAAPARDALLRRFSIAGGLLLALLAAALGWKLFFGDLGLPLRRYTPPTPAAAAANRCALTALTELDGAEITALATDGQWLYFAAGNAVYRIEKDGSDRRQLFATEAPVTALALGADGSLYLGANTAQAAARLCRASVDAWGVSVEPFGQALPGDFCPTALAFGPDGTLYIAAAPFSDHSLAPARLRLLGYLSHDNVAALYACSPQGQLTQLQGELPYTSGLAAQGNALLALWPAEGQLATLAADTGLAAGQSLPLPEGFASGLALQNGAPLCGLEYSRQRADALAGHPVLRHLALSLPAPLRQGWLGLSQPDSRVALLCEGAPLLLESAGTGGVQALCADGAALYLAAGSTLYAYSA